MTALLDAVLARRETIHAVARKHRATAIAVFGSVARGEDGPDSDIDFLVDFAPEASLRDLIALQDDLETAFGRRVDVVSVGGLLDRDRQIRADAVPV